MTAFLTSSINSFLLNERGSSSQRWRTMTRICLLLILRLGFPSVEGSLQQHMRKAGAVLRTLYIFTWLPPFFHKHRCRIRSRNFRNNRKLNTYKYIRLSLLPDWQLKPTDWMSVFISESSDIAWSYKSCMNILISDSRAWSYFWSTPLQCYEGLDPQGGRKCTCYMSKTMRVHWYSMYYSFCDIFRIKIVCRKKGCFFSSKKLGENVCMM